MASTTDGRVSVAVPDGVEVTAAGAPQHLIVYGNLDAAAAWLDAVARQVRNRAQAERATALNRQARDE